MTTPTATPPDAPMAPATSVQVVRETIESLAVAFVLALLFKAFVAEAFVIPTGSMAPTLMGAHKDIRCEDCGYQYQCGASNEFTETGARSDRTVVATTCPLCRKPQIADPSQDSNQVTFSGDRILVSKLAYVFAAPRRWDVIVFKYILDARLNYIKRCIGLPNETVRIREGDIYIQENSGLVEQKQGQNAGPTSSFAIARKPPQVVEAMLQKLFDSKHVSKSLVEVGVPNAWQPFPSASAPEGSGGNSTWKINQSVGKWQATVSTASPGSTQWIRYFHRVIDPLSWEKIVVNQKLDAPVAPQSSRLITDFTAYNASFSRFTPKELNEPFSQFAADTISNSIRNWSPANQPIENDGIHWTGDLAVEVDVVLGKDAKSIALLLIEAGVQHECRIDLTSGQATATVSLDGKSVDAFDAGDGKLAANASVATSVRAGARHRLKFANVDDTLILWIDGKHLAWKGDMMTLAYLPLTDRVPKTTPTNPLDAAPVGIGVDGGSAELTRVQVYRDIYYIAQGNQNQSLYDYREISTTLRDSSSPANNERYAREVHNMSASELIKQMSQEGLLRNAILTNPTLWAQSPFALNRQVVDFPMQDDWYFPMGDNSSASADARSWGHTPERLMIGRAVMVFWPHYWNAPIPFVPNVQRMGLIR